jgi:hypothetical protein
MRLLRLLMITATLISLPGYGLAATGHVRGCPERAPAGAADMAMDGMAMDGMAVADDCCPGAAGQHAPDQHAPDKSGGCAACQAGHTCKSPQGVQFVHAPILMVVPVHQPAMAGTAPRASLCSPDGLLRPPDLA